MEIVAKSLRKFVEHTFPIFIFSIVLDSYLPGQKSHDNCQPGYGSNLLNTDLEQMSIIELQAQ
jgi:hypothetical protein